MRREAISAEMILCESCTNINDTECVEAALDTTGYVCSSMDGFYLVGPVFYLSKHENKIHL